MKRIVFCLCTLCIVATGCQQTIRDNIVKNKAQETFAMFWHDIDENYVFFDDKHGDWDAFYTKGMDILGNATEDNIREIADSIVREIADIQIYLWAYRQGFRYYGEDSLLSKYADPCGGWRGNYPKWENNTDPYIFDGGEECFTGACIYTFHRNGDSITPPYLYVTPGLIGWGSDVKYNKEFWKENMSQYAANSKGVVLEMRDIKEMKWDDMLELLKYFLPQGANTIFYTREREPSSNNRITYTTKAPYIVEGYGTFADMPLCIIFDASTQNEANIMTYVLYSMHPKVTTISKGFTLGGGGMRSTHTYITKDESFGFHAKYPSVRLSNDKYDSFNAPLYPDISVPYEGFVYNRRGMIDRCLEKSMDVLDNNR